MKKILTVLLSLFWVCGSSAQEDPGLAALIYAFTKKAESQYKSQMATMNLIAEGHVFVNQEIKATKDFQKQFDDYVSSFRNVIVYAAQIYGFYYEIDHMVKNMQALTHQIGDSPANAVAVALHHNRNDIYIDIITTSMGVIKNIRKVCCESKMTEKQRTELVFEIRPKLKKLNYKLMVLTKMVKYTNLNDLWRDLTAKAHEGPLERSDIIEQSLEDWIANGKKVKVKVNN